MVINAKERGHTTLVISAHSDHRTLSEDVLNATSSLFQVNRMMFSAVMDLAEK